MEVIVCMTEQQWREQQIQEARCEARARQRRWDAKHEADRERRLYFCQQKLYGVFMAVLSLVLLVLTREGFCVAGILLGAYAIITKQMILVNEYWWEQQGKEGERK